MQQERPILNDNVQLLNFFCVCFKRHRQHTAMLKRTQKEMHAKQAKPDTYT